MRLVYMLKYKYYVLSHFVVLYWISYEKNGLSYVLTYDIVYLSVVDDI